MLTKDEYIVRDSISYQWDFYERAANNYSVIIRMLQCINNKKEIIEYAPEIFVEEMGFDFCMVLINDVNGDKYKYFSIDNADDIPEPGMLNGICAGIMSPALFNDINGYKAVYVYPINNNMDIIGHMVLGKRYSGSINKQLLNELKMLCDVFSMLLTTSQDLALNPANDSRNKIFEKMLDDLPDPLFLLDKNGFVVYANKRADDEFKGEKNHLVGESFAGIFHNIDDKIASDDMMFNGKVEYQIGHAYKVFELRCWPLEEGHFSNGFLKCAHLRDTTEENIDNQQQIQKGKAESISLFTSGIAHDFNNHLTGILGYASLMKTHLEKDERLSKYAAAIESSAKNAAKLTQHLLNFSRRQRNSAGIVDINAIMNDLIFLLETSYKDIEIDKHLSEQVSLIKGNETEIQNALLNIFINAKDAMNGIGHLCVTTGRKDTEKKGFITIEIEDSGAGISEELKQRIFEPYFSTKRNDTNKGIGLYLVKKTISDHGGFIEIDSKPGKGTTFIIYLPVNAVKKTNNLSQKIDSTRRIKPKLHALVVDDEDTIRKFVNGVLTDAGLKVIEAKDGNEAIEIFKTSHNNIDLVILDMIMPGIKGDKVLKEMRKICNDTKIIVASGFMSEHQRESLKEEHVDAFLNKPFTDKNLIRTICSLPDLSS